MKKNSVNDLIAQKKYFDVGFHWYFDKYLSFFWQKRLYFYFFIVSLVTFFIIVKMNTDVLVDHRVIAPVVTYTDNYDEIAFIRKLQIAGIDDPNILVANYLIEKYIIAMESYDFKNIDEQKMFIKSNSSSFLYMNFDDYMSIDDSSSPILLYGMRDKINVAIKSIDIKSDESGVPNMANVKFATFKNDVLLEEKQAVIEFYIDNVFNVSKTKDAKFNFLVFKYEKF